MWDGGHNGISLVEISKIFTTKRDLFRCNDIDRIQSQWRYKSLLCGWSAQRKAGIVSLVDVSIYR